MSPPDRPYRVFISAADPSADQHAAALINAFRIRFPDAEFVGLAGPHMQAAGCRPLADLTARATMLLDVVTRIPEAATLLGRVDRFLARVPVDAATLIDSGTLHLPMARRCQARGIPVLYYIAPQTWASRRWRIRALRQRVDRLAVILPFEEEHFRSHGIRVRYVGHPLFDRLAGEATDTPRAAELRGGGRPVVVLLPGSRRQVVRQVLPGQIDVARQIAGRFHRARFVLAAANQASAALARDLIASDPAAPPIEYQLPPHGDLLHAADLALVASGTATLEVAYHHLPMIVMYNARVARWAYSLLRRWIIHTEHLSLPNILAGRRIVPEFMPFYEQTSEIGVVAIELLSSDKLRERMRAELSALMTPIVRTGASSLAAGELAELLAERVRSSQRAVPVGSRHRLW